MGWPSIIAGAHLKCFVNGRLLGWTAGFAPRIRTPVRAAGGIDTSTTFELMPTTYNVSGSMDVYRGRWQGGLEGLGMVAFAHNLLRQRYCTIELVDRLSDTVVFKAVGCVVTDQTWKVTPKGVVVGTFQFEGLDASNEADQ